GRVARLVAHVGEVERVARRLEAHPELLLGGRAFADVDERVGDFAERGLDRALVAGERLLAPRLSLVEARLAAAGIEDRAREAGADRPNAAAPRDQVVQLRALRAERRRERDRGKL